MGMNKLLGLALAGFLSTVQIAGAVSYGAHEDSAHSANAYERDEARRLQAQLDDLRHQSATKQELANQSPVKQDNFGELSFAGAAPLASADPFSLVLTSSNQGGSALSLGQTVTSVPLVSAGWLLLSSIGGLGLVRRKARG